jgi:hypothetical protein
MARSTIRFHDESSPQLFQSTETTEDMRAAWKDMEGHVDVCSYTRHLRASVAHSISFHSFQETESRIKPYNGTNRLSAKVKAHWIPSFLHQQAILKTSNAYDDIVGWF